MNQNPKYLISDETGVVTKISPRSVPDTLKKLLQLIEQKGMQVFAVIDHSAEAKQIGMSLRETTLVIFGSPKAGTPAMVASPLAALDLPLKILVWADTDSVKISYNSPAYLAERYSLSDDIAAPLSGIELLSDALTSP